MPAFNARNTNPDIDLAFTKIVQLDETEMGEEIAAVRANLMPGSPKPIS